LELLPFDLAQSVLRFPVVGLMVRGYFGAWSYAFDSHLPQARRCLCRAAACQYPV